MIILTRKQLLAAALLGVALVAVVLGFAYRDQLVAGAGAQKPADAHVAHDSAAMPEPKERKVLYWYDPMHPQYQFDQPGIAPDCGMPLVPKYAEDAAPMRAMPTGAVQISPAKQQLIGVRTAPVAAEDLTQTLRAVGLVQVDETRVARVHTKVSGWVRRVFVDYTWEHVERGAPLFTLYSPELVSAQKEYLIARRAESYLGQAPYREAAAGSEALLRAARERLKLWDVTDEQIRLLEERGAPQEEMTFYAPVGGHVTTRNVFPNQYITPESDLYILTDHSRVWAQAQLYEYEVAGVRVGQSARMTVEAYPGRVFEGRVAFIDPHLDAATRTVRVRLEFDNPELALKPEMFSTIELEVPLGRRLVVPRDAVLDTGTRQIVFLALPDGYFQPREIQIGQRLGDRLVVLAGLQPGDTIVTSGVFLIDSESRLKSALEGMQH
jgi:RND family efflux transporter MFP subunit